MGLSVKRIECPDRVDLSLRIPAPIVCFKVSFSWWFLRVTKVIRIIVERSILAR